MECYSAPAVGTPTARIVCGHPPPKGVTTGAPPGPPPPGTPCPMDSNGNNAGAKPSAAEAAQALSDRGRPLRPKAQWVRYGHLPPYGTPT